MEKAHIKIKKKENGDIKKEFKGSHKNLSIPKEFSFLEDYDGECEIELVDGKLVKIIIQGKEVSKDDTILQYKQLQHKRAEETKKQQQELEKAAKNIPEKQSSGSGATNLYSIENTKLPKNTRNILTNLHEIDNYALKINKTVNFIKDKDKEKAILYQKESKNKEKRLEKFEIPFNYADTTKFKGLFQSIQNRQSQAIDQLGLAKVEREKLQPDWRLALGLGNASVYETSLTLHHIYGIPYIPSSSIKGTVRSYVITEVFGTAKEAGEREKDFPLVNAEFRAYQNKEFCQVFGCPAEVQAVTFKDGKPVQKKDQSYEMESPTSVALDGDNQGHVFFFDAFPISEPKIDVDIMNPHYPEYYKDSDNSKNVAPTDYQNPIPVYFLTIKNCKFQFVIGVKNPVDIELLIIAKQWLLEALTEKGIGAKTAVGYGYMV